MDYHRDAEQSCQPVHDALRFCDEATAAWCIMAITEMRHFLTCLGWKSSDEGRREDGRWCVRAKSCGHTVIAIGETQEEAWSAACSTALNVTAPSLRKLREGRE